MTTHPARQQRGDAETARVVARPPWLFLFCLALGLALDRVLPLPLFLPLAAWLLPAGGMIVVVGIAIFSAGVRGFIRASTPVPSTQPVRSLVTTGIHGWSRNPIYLGMFLIYGGIALLLESLWTLLLTMPLALVMRYGVIAREEVYLERRFGDVYCNYKASVRRWL